MTTCDDMTPELISDDERREPDPIEVHAAYLSYENALQEEFPHAQTLPFPKWLSLHTTLKAIAEQQ
jgi:hypothetical protein